MAGLQKNDRIDLGTPRARPQMDAEMSNAAGSGWPAALYLGVPTRSPLRSALGLAAFELGARAWPVGPSPSSGALHRSGACQSPWRRSCQRQRGRAFDLRRALRAMRGLAGVLWPACVTTKPAQPVSATFTDSLVRTSAVLCVPRAYPRDAPGTCAPTLSSWPIAAPIAPRIEHYEAECDVV